MNTLFFQGLSPAGYHRIAYHVWGNGPRTIVCVHGLTRNGRDFARLGEALAPHARIVAIDLPGRGASDALPAGAFYTHAQYLADLTALIARLDTEEIDWIGTSLGGLLGILAAAMPATPVRRLVLNDVGPFTPAQAVVKIATYIQTQPHFPNFDAARAYIRKIYAQTGPCTEADYEELTQASLRPDGMGGYKLAYDAAIADMIAPLAGDVDLWNFYDQIRCPTLVLRGALSDILPATTAQDMTRRGPHARLVEIPEIGHCPALMDGAQINLLRNFLEL